MSYCELLSYFESNPSKFEQLRIKIGREAQLKSIRCKTTVHVTNLEQGSLKSKIVGVPLVYRIKRYELCIDRYKTGLIARGYRIVPDLSRKRRIKVDNLGLSGKLYSNFSSSSPPEVKVTLSSRVYRRSSWSIPLCSVLLLFFRTLSRSLKN